MYVIGITGGTASGKTVFAEKILENIKDPDNILVISHDSYYYCLKNYSEEEIEGYNFDHPDSLDTDLLVSNLIKLKNGEKCKQPIYDYKTHSRSDTHTVLEPKAIVIVDGILLFYEKKLRDLVDIKIYVETDADIRLARRIKRDCSDRGRDIDTVLEQYINTVKIMHDNFVEPTKRYADIIIPAENYNPVALSIINSKIQQKLNEFQNT
jgi:uridine kinase